MPQLGHIFLTYLGPCESPLFDFVLVAFLGKYCNIKKPNVITSTGNSISMKFVSNARRHGKGFFVQYRRHKTGSDHSFSVLSRLPSWHNKYVRSIFD